MRSRDPIRGEPRRTPAADRLPELGVQLKAGLFPVISRGISALVSRGAARRARGGFGVLGLISTRRATASAWAAWSTLAGSSPGNSPKSHDGGAPPAALMTTGQVSGRNPAIFRSASPCGTIIAYVGIPTGAAGRITPHQAVRP